MRIFFKYTLFYSTLIPSEGNHSNNRQCCYKNKCCGSPNSPRAFIDAGLPTIVTHLYECMQKMSCFFFWLA